MDEKTVKKLSTLVTVIIAIAVGVSVAQRNYFLLVIAITAGLALMHIIRSRARVEGIVLEDERLELIASKASDRTFRVVTIALAVVGFALKALNNPMGDILLYIGCLMLMIYLVFYRYYASKFGGL